MGKQSALYKKLISEVDQNDLKTVQLVRLLADHIECYWNAAKLIESDGLLTQTEGGALKPHPAIQIRNSSSKEICTIAKLLGINSVKVEEVKDIGDMY